ncbi:hypothetical protein E1301_Tti012971 [Triplophysa tibetana]|uniref:Uncharacterized protein n=1 Tax=Triplophysa tibetana TaxID=1572043 RepID=A0A5A9NSI0_9TELE|nr:hypothetical protein E1301_Tti012971 [Triplophysa tibetana]
MLIFSASMWEEFIELRPDSASIAPGHHAVVPSLRGAPHSWLLSRDASGFMELRGRDDETVCACRAVERGFKEPQRHGSPSRSPGSVRMAFCLLADIGSNPSALPRFATGRGWGDGSQLSYRDNYCLTDVCVGLWR